MAWCGTKKANKLLTMDPSSILVFDLETTGINTSTAEILQISVADGNGITLFSSYVKPAHARKWNGAEKVNHISPEMVKTAPTFSDIRAKVQQLFDQAKLVAGYNIKGFDIPVIERHGIVVPLNRFDVMEEFRMYTARAVGFRLKDCAEYFNVSFTPHNAVDDACTTALCMRQLIRKPGFVSNALKAKNATVSKETSSKVEDQKLPLRARLLKPFLKKRKYSLVFVGLLLMLICFCWIGYRTYGSGFVTALGQIEFSRLLETIKSSKADLCAGVFFTVGGLCFVTGVISAIVKLIRRVVNRFRKTIRRLVD